MRRSGRRRHLVSAPHRRRHVRVASAGSAPDHLGEGASPPRCPGVGGGMVAAGPTGRSLLAAAAPIKIEAAPRRGGARASRRSTVGVTRSRAQPAVQPDAARDRVSGRNRFRRGDLDQPAHRAVAAGGRTAVGIDGRIRFDMPESGRADEIGALSRGSNGYSGGSTNMLSMRTLGGKFSHELRTPLTIVRSSLDNLESEVVRADQREYLTRAREGASACNPF